MVNGLIMRGIRNHQRQAGVSLVEVLVAMVIFSFGMLGLLGLQTAVLRNQSQAGMRVGASLALSDIVEQMRGNVAGASQYVFVSQSVSPTPAPLLGCTDVCSAADIANLDMERWKASLTRFGGSITGKIVADTATGGYKATVTWVDVRVVADQRCDSSGADQAQCCDAAQTGLHCMNVYFVL